MNSTDKRVSKRFPIMHQLAEPVLVRTESSKSEKSIPAVMANLSASGMALLTFLPLAIGKILFMSFDLRHVKIDNIKSKVVRCDTKDGTYVLGIKFLGLPNGVKTKINKMADASNPR